MENSLKYALINNKWIRNIFHVDINFAPTQIWNTIAYGSHAYHISILRITSLIYLYIAVVLCVVIGQLQINATITQSADNSVICMLIIFVLIIIICAYYLWLEIHNKTIIGFSFWFSPFEMYNKTIIGFDFCDMQNYQCLDKSYLLPRHR